MKIFQLLLPCRAYRDILYDTITKYLLIRIYFLCVCLPLVYKRVPLNVQLYKQYLAKTKYVLWWLYRIYRCSKLLMKNVGNLIRYNICCYWSVVCYRTCISFDSNQHGFNSEDIVTRVLDILHCFCEWCWRYVILYHSCYMALI